MADVFTRELTNLLRVLKTVMDVRNNNLMGLGKKENLISKYLARYTKRFTKTEADLIRAEIGEVYQKHRRSIMTSNSVDGWLLEKTIDFQAEPLNPDCDKTIRVMLSIIYKTAKTMANDYDPDSDHPVAKYPSEILLHVYRIFHEIEPTKGDREILNKWISELEGNLDISAGEDKPAENPFGSIMAAAMPVLKNMLPEMPQGEKGMPSADQMIGLASSLFQDKKLQETLGKISNKLKNCASIESVMTEVGRALDETKLLDGFKPPAEAVPAVEPSDSA